MIECIYFLPFFFFFGHVNEFTGNFLFSDTRYIESKGGEYSLREREFL